MRSFSRHLWAVTYILASFHGLSLARSRDLTKAEAQELVAAVLGPRAHLPGFGFDDAEYSDPKARDFYTFEVSFRNPGGMQVLGHYAVHKVTGAAWEFVLCRKLDSEELRKLQSTLRKRIGLGSEELRRLDNVSPCYQPE